MKKLISIAALLTVFIGFSQEEIVQSVYFDFDKYDLDQKQSDAVVNFIKTADSSRIESVEIFGYTDDIGKDAYNFKLSTNRATTIKDALLANGITNKIIVTIEERPYLDR